MIDHGEAASPGPVHRDGLTLGVQLHSGGRVGGVLDNADVSLVRALRDLDGLADELLVSAEAASATPPASATATSHPPASLPALAGVGGAAEPRTHEPRQSAS